jgi:DNA/RNA endonuclease YhcR with UshA esterase domain
MDTNGHNMRIKLFCLIVVATLAVLDPARADETNAPAPVKIAATMANKHYGETAIVTGKIVEVTVRPAVVILNFEQPFSNAPFTGVIFNRSTNKFGDLKSLKGKTVEVQGPIKPYRGKPEIILTNAHQLTIIAPPPGTETPAPGPAQPVKP